jgi:hypothetical protein
MIADLVRLALRVAYPTAEPAEVPIEAPSSGAPRARRRPDVMLLAVETDEDQELLGACWRRLRFDRLYAEGIVVPDDTDDPSLVEVDHWVVHNLRPGRFARDAVGPYTDRLTPWCEEVFRPAITAAKAPTGRPVGGRSWVMTWDVAAVASRVCRHPGVGGREFYGGWSLGLFDAPNAPGAGTGYPRLRLRQLRDGVVSARWGGTPTNAKGERPRRLPPILDLRHLVAAVAGPALDSLDSACTAFEIRPAGATGGGWLDRVASRVETLDGLQRAVLREIDWWSGR